MEGDLFLRENMSVEQFPGGSGDATTTQALNTIEKN